MTVGQRIKAARKKVGMTQAELAQKLGISYVGISQWENDLRKPKIETIQRIAAALGVEWNELIPEEKQENRFIFRPQRVNVQETALDREKINLIAEKEMADCPAYKSVIRIEGALSKLNDAGLEKAADAVEIIAEIPRYRAETPPQSTPEAPGGTDTTPPPNGPEEPPEGK